MPLNIKNEEAHALARELAQLTGQSITGAVTEAIRMRLEALKRTSSEERCKRILAIGEDCAPRLAGLSMEHGDLLYDENGLP